MAASTQWMEDKYQETLEAELRGLQRRRAREPDFRPEDLRATLHHLYILEGSDWEGRGEVQDITLAATIAAYERFLFEWEGAAGNSGAEA